jgi:hypothetical protein
MIFDTHTECIDEDCKEYSLLEVFVLHHSLDDFADAPETGAKAGRHPPPGRPAPMMSVVSLGASTPLQYHGPVPSAGLFVATELMIWAVAPAVRASLVVPQHVQTLETCKKTVTLF